MNLEHTMYLGIHTTTKGLADDDYALVTPVVVKSSIATLDVANELSTELFTNVAMLNTIFLCDQVTVVLRCFTKDDNPVPDVTVPEQCTITSGDGDFIKKLVAFDDLARYAMAQGVVTTVTAKVLDRRLNYAYTDVYSVVPQKISAKVSIEY